MIDVEHLNRFQHDPVKKFGNWGNPRPTSYIRSLENMLALAYGALRFALMNIPWTLAIMALGLSYANCAITQEVRKDENPKKESAQLSFEKKAKVFSQDDLETKFKAMLTKATLSGRWSPIDNGRLGPEKSEDKYWIAGAKKIEGESWVINASMKQDHPEMVLPIPVLVKWSGDTAVVIVNDLSMGKNRSYSARVLFFGDTYAGTWTGSSGYGGLIYGTISRDTSPSSKPAEQKNKDQK